MASLEAHSYWSLTLSVLPSSDHPDAYRVLGRAVRTDVDRKGRSSCGVSVPVVDVVTRVLPSDMLNALLRGLEPVR